MHTILSIKQSEQSDPPIFGFNVTVKNISEITMRLSRQKHKASNIMQPCMVALCPLYKVNQRLYAEASFLQAQMKACGLPPPLATLYSSPFPSWPSRVAGCLDGSPCCSEKDGRPWGISKMDMGESEKGLFFRSLNVTKSWDDEKSTRGNA